MTPALAAPTPVPHRSAPRPAWDLDALCGFGTPAYEWTGWYGPWATLRWPCGCQCEWHRGLPANADARQPVVIGTGDVSAARYCRAHVEASAVIPVLVIDQRAAQLIAATHLRDIPEAAWESGNVRLTTTHALATAEWASGELHVHRDGRLTMRTAAWDSSG